MKALSIKQPHINRILNGLKIYEIRSWRTNYRGEILLCASAQIAKGFDNEDDLITGHALGVANIVDVIEYKPYMRYAAMTDYISNHYAWVLENIKKIKPFPVKGKLSLFDINYPRNKTASL